MANVRITRTRDGEQLNVTKADLNIYLDRMAEPFTVGAVPNNDAVSGQDLVDAFRGSAKWFDAGAAVFLQNFGIEIEAFRNGATVSWDPRQQSLLSLFDIGAGLVTLGATGNDVLRDMTMRDAGKTPDQARTKLVNEFNDANQRGKATLVLFSAYRNGIYAPIGALGKNNVFNDKNMKKFIGLQSLTLQQKQMVIAVFKRLDIGAKGGFSLNHYIKALYGGEIRAENQLVANKGMIDYYFFQRGSNFLGYWIQYATHYFDLVESINATARRQGGGRAMNHKRDTDLIYDANRAPALTECGRGQPIRWDIITQNNCAEVAYFAAVCLELRNVDEGYEALSSLAIDTMKGALVLADGVIAKRVLKSVLKLKNVPAIWDRIKQNAKSMNINLNHEVFTQAEKVAGNAKGISFKGWVPPPPP